MANYRRFWLINSLGNRYDFTLKEHDVFLDSPQGLGFKKTITTQRIGDDEIITDEQYELPTVTGDILFLAANDYAYEEYRNFIDFIKHTPLVLHYQTPNSQYSYYMNCQITNLEKTEYDSDGRYLQCPITFTGNSLWLNAQNTVLEVSNNETGEGKYYPLERPYYYSGSSLTDITLNNLSDIPVGFIFEVIGDVTNPKLTVLQNDVSYGIIKINGSFDYLKVDTNDSSESIYLEKDGNEIANPVSYQDLDAADGISQLTFFKLKVGESRLSFTCDSIASFDGNIKLVWQDKRISV